MARNTISVFPSALLKEQAPQQFWSPLPLAVLAHTYQPQCPSLSRFLSVTRRHSQSSRKSLSSLGSSGPSFTLKDCWAEQVFPDLVTRFTMNAEGLPSPGS